jgi:phosphatidate cytidylyltransferase
MTRVLSGAVMVALAMAVVWFAPASLFLVVAQVLLLLAFHEYSALAGLRPGAPAFARGIGSRALAALAAAAAVSASLAMAVPSSNGSLVVVTLLAIVVALGAASMTRWSGGPDALATVAVAAFPTLYLGLPIGALVLIRERHGARGLFLLMLTVMISDTAQYYTGRALGRRPLAPAISPKKTLEGAVGGFVFGSLAFTLIGMSWLPQPSWSWPVRAALGVVIVAAGIAGDLFESMLKRSAGVKDSSSLIPGHGGVLDRIDALLFAAPLYFAALTFL